MLRQGLHVDGFASVITAALAAGFAALSLGMGCVNTIVPAPACERAIDCPDGEACVSGRCEVLPEGAGGDRAEPLVPQPGDGGAGVGEGEGEPSTTCDPAHCDDGVFCNGVETCDDETDACGAGAPPCPPDRCDEGRDLCADPPDDAGVGPSDDAGDEDPADEDAGAPDSDDAGAADADAGAPGSDDAGAPPVDAGCQPSCTGKQCGDDGCGGDCGVCGDYQDCTADGTCVFVGDVCDALTDVLTLSAFQTRSGSLSATTDEIYGFDRPYARILDSYLFDVLAPGQTETTVTATSTDFDMVLYAYDDVGTCTEIAKNDDIDGATNRNSRFTLAAGHDATQIVVTSFEQQMTGAYSVTTTSKLCGLTVTAAVYNQCAPLVAARAPPNDPCNWNPCLDYGNEPEFCCIKEACRTGFGNGNAIVIEQDPNGCNVP